MPTTVRGGSAKRGRAADARAKWLATPLAATAACGMAVFRIIDHYAPNFSSSVIGRDVLSPWDLEQIFGLTGGVRAVPAAAGDGAF